MLSILAVLNNALVWMVSTRPPLDGLHSSAIGWSPLVLLLSLLLFETRQLNANYLCYNGIFNM